MYRAHDNSRYYNHPVKPYGVTEIEFYLESELWGPKEKPGFPVALGIFADYGMPDYGVTQHILTC